jgi:hypothetical protein
METIVTNKEVLGYRNTKDLMNAFDNALYHIIDIIKENNYVVMINGEESNIANLASIPINSDILNNMSKNGKKKMAKRIYISLERKSLRSINLFFHVMIKIGVITGVTIKIKPSHQEQELIKLRAEYKRLKVQIEEARIILKVKKGLFYH